MSGQLRALKNRIRGVENTKKITKAMEMVAAAKLKRFQFLRNQSAPYLQALENLVARVLETGPLPHHPLLTERPEAETALLLLTSDTGLCGSYNNDLVDEAKKFIKNKKKTPLLIGVGKTGVNALSRAGLSWHKTFTDTKTLQCEAVIKKVELLFEALYREKKIDSVYVIYTHFVDKMVYRATLEKLLPFRVVSPAVAAPAGSPYILEPNRTALFTKLIPLAFEAKIRMLFLEAFISEQMARMNSMYQATENAKELIESLVLLRNKVRQAAITKELIEIVSGSQALKNSV